MLAQEAGPVFFGGVHEEFVGLLASFEKLLGHIRSGGGLSLEDYPDSHVRGYRPIHRRLVRKSADSSVAAAGPARSEQSSRTVRASRTSAAGAAAH